MPACDQFVTGTSRIPLLWPLPVGHRDRCPRVHKTWLETITSRLGQHFKSELMKQHALLWSEKFSLHSRSMRKGPSMEVLPMVLHCTLKGSKLQSTALSNIPIKITERRDEGTKGRRDEGTKGRRDEVRTNAKMNLDRFDRPPR